MTDNTGSIRKGRDMYSQLHPTKEEREQRRADQPRPKRGEKSVAAGRALHDSRGKYAPDYSEGA